jgi:ATP-dependent Clp protease ATP-binding subunit ClpA
MFEKYTEKARRVIFFARYEASQFGAKAIEPEHILLGILREDKGLVQRFFGESDRILGTIHKEIESRVGVKEKVSTSVDLPLSPPAKRVLSYSQAESERLEHRYIGTEHLLLGLLCEEQSIAFEILSERGLRLEQIREDLGRRHEPFGTHLDTGAPPTESGGISGLVGKYTKKAALCFPLSWQWAARDESPKVGPEHLLLALMTCDQWLVIHFLPRGRAAFDEIADELSESVRETLTSPARPLTEATLLALSYADEEARRVGHEKVDTEHLLLGILADEESTASRVLRRHGMDPDRIRDEAFGES